MTPPEIAALLRRNLETPLEPLPTGLVPDVRRMNEVRAVIFDIYGTLFVSGSGDIGVAAAQNGAEAMLCALRGVGLSPDAKSASLISGLFVKSIRKAQNLRQAEGVVFPEVEIREVWVDFIKTLLRDDLATGSLPNADAIERVCIDYECRVNPVWPMPGLKESLSCLQNGHMLMGIVSNAQFFTPPLFDAFLGHSVEELDFEPSCVVYSYQLREAKPSTTLFELLVAGLREHGFSPEQALYVGNDMRNDIAPAHALGMRTCLFAADKCSLRLREGDPMVDGLRPDRILTDLSQLCEITG